MSLGLACLGMPRRFWGASVLRFIWKASLRLGIIDLLVYAFLFNSSSCVQRRLCARHHNYYTVGRPLRTLLRWAIMNFVVRVLSMNAFRISASVAVSTALVESSSISILAIFKSALAMQSLCLWPPDTVRAACSMKVSYPSGKDFIKPSPEPIRRRGPIPRPSRLVAPAEVFLLVTENRTFFWKQHRHVVAQRFNVVVLNIHAAHHNAAFSRVVKAGD